MDTRRLIVALVTAMAVFYVWIALSTMMGWTPDKPPAQEDQALVDPSTTQPTTLAPASMPSTGTAQVGNPTTMTGDQTAYVVADSSSMPIILGDASDDSDYPMQVEIVPSGASVREVLLRDEKDQVKRRGHTPQPYPILGEVAASERIGEQDYYYSFTTKSIRLQTAEDTYQLDLDRVNWHAKKLNDEQVELTAIIQVADRKIVRIKKTYTLKKQPQKNLSSDLVFSVDIENLTDQPIQATIVQRGPIGLRREDLRSDYRSVLSANWTDNGLKREKKAHLRKEIINKNNLILSSDIDEPDEGATRIAWVGESNKFFACIVAPADRNNNQDAKRFADVRALHLTDIAESNDQAYDLRQDLTFEFTTTPLSLAAGDTDSVGFECFLGAKRKAAFQNVPRYLELQYQEIISINFYACAPTAVVWVMMGLLSAFERVVGNYGIAIIILVLVVRTVLHPITKKSQVNMFKMQKDMALLKPKLEAIKEKYSNDRQRLNQETMKVYQEEGVNPAGGMLSCLPMMLQIPIWGALWAGLNFTVEMRHQPFDGWWIKDLTAPDALMAFNEPVSIPLIGFLLGGPISSFNLLPVLLAISQMLQMKFMPRSTPAMQDSQAGQQMETQRRMMMFMSVFFMFILYNAPSGLNLYIMSSNLFGILEQWRIRNHLKEMDEKKAKEAVAPKKPKEPRKKGWLGRHLEEIQKSVDKGRRIQSIKKKTSKK